MNKKRLVVFFLIFCIMYVFNIFTPLLNDDYFLAFIWPVGAGINELPKNVTRIADIFDVLQSLKSYYLSWGGRIPGQFFMVFFIWQGKEYFNFINSLIFVLLIAEIYWLSHEGKISFDFKVSYILWIFFSLWSFNFAFTETFLWLSGACEYLWTMVLLLAFLTPYVQNYYDSSLLRKYKVFFSIVMFLLGVLAGCSRETLVCWLILVLAFWLHRCRLDGNLQAWKITGFIGLCVGYALLIFAPGNNARLVKLESMGAIISLSNGVLSYKLAELVMTLLFHVFLWYFLLNFLFRYRTKVNETEKKYLNIIKLSAFIAFCSWLMMMLIPTRAVRTSFVALTFLIIAACTTYRIQENSEIIILSKGTKSALKLLGCIYMVLTISVSLWGNYTNWYCWNSIVTQLKNSVNTATTITIKVIPPLSGYKWFLGSGFVHLTGLPIYKNGPLNTLIARYYGLKGIRVIQ